MRIQHNIMAMNAYRNYNTNTSALSKNLEKLSSGYKINRAGDDAAGLAISEKMRAQITGLDAAQKNVKDGISLVKTAEGAMQEVQDMLNRMDYLATQSANGTYQNEVDRENLQKEVDALKNEINRIADSANFNGIKLLDGSLAKADAVKAGTTTEDFSGMDRIITSVLGKGESASMEAGKKTILDDVAGAASAVKASFSVDLGTLEFQVSGASGTTASFSVTLTIGGKEMTVTASVSVGAKASAVAKAIASAVVAAYGTSGDITGSKGFEINGVKWDVTASGSKLNFKQKYAPMTQDEARANFDVNIKLNEGGGVLVKPPAQTGDQETKFSMSASLNAGTTVNTAGVALEDVNKANTVFNIKESDIKDGTQIAIGSMTFVLKVGNSAISTAEAARLTKAGATIVTIGANDNLYTALCKISAKASTVNFTVKGANGKTTTVAFKLGVSDGSNGNVVGLTVQRVDKATSADTAFTDIKALADNFAMRVKTTTEAKDATNGLTLQIGDTSDSFNQMSVVIGDMHTTGMGIDGVDISTQEGAAAAVQTIRDAINYVSGIRGDLGAVQNRLEHTGNNLSVMAENIQDAESTIRDTDVAEEMMSYVKNNILVQSAQAMLAQANQVPQGVLQLLG